MPSDDGRLSFLLGAWTGEGRGLWDSDDPFIYSERVFFTSDGRPFVSYTQATWAPDGRPLHSETGYLRPGPEGRIELVLAQPTGIVEVDTGSESQGVIELRSVAVQRTPSALPVREVSRRLLVTGDTLSYELAIAMNDEKLAPHLTGSLTRQSVRVGLYPGPSGG
jgi:hypothetical protein